MVVREDPLALRSGARELTRPLEGCRGLEHRVGCASSREVGRRLPYGPTVLAASARQRWMSAARSGKPCSSPLNMESASFASPCASATRARA